MIYKYVNKKLSLCKNVLKMWLLSLWIFSTGAIISSILVITSVKAINAIICLIIAFINAIGIFMLLGVDFIALIYCIVYVGAIAILFLFVIMLLSENGELEETAVAAAVAETNKNMKSMSSITENKNMLLNNRPMVILIGVLYIVEVWCGIAAGSWNRGLIGISENNYSSSAAECSNGVISLLHNKNCITGLGEMLYSECGYEVLLIISLILLVGMIGSIVLTLRPNQS
jgi:NADH:ubiquinone oxidoreductase subunit 6 (subunit J)